MFNFLAVTFFIVSAFFVVFNTVNAATLYVGSIGDFTTIQNAIDVAGAGDTINISPGTYNESLLITKPLKIIGINKPLISGNSDSYVIKVDGTNSVSIENLEIIGVTSESALAIENSSNVSVSRNTISLFYKNGIRFTKSEGQINYNVITGDTVDGISRAQNLINIRNGSDVEINNNTLSHAVTKLRSPEKFDSTCIFVNAYPDSIPSNANIHDNELSFCDIGVAVTSMRALIDQSTVTIENNNMSDLIIGVNFEKDTGHATIFGNTYKNVEKETDAYAGNAIAMITPQSQMALAGNATMPENSNTALVIFSIIVVLAIAGRAYRKYS